MRPEDLAAALQAAWTAARDRDLPPVIDEDQEVRPDEGGFDYRIFPQSWPSTAGGMDAASRAFGRAFCTRPTVVIQTQEAACVYFNGVLGYTIDLPCPTFTDDLDRMDPASQKSAVRKYGARLPEFSGKPETPRTPEWFIPAFHDEFHEWLWLQDNVTHSRPFVTLVWLWAADEAWHRRGPERPYR